jgi:hypothetical protein
MTKNYHFTVFYFIFLVIPELKSKNDKIITYGFNTVCGVSFLSRVVDAYTVYFSKSSTLPLTATILHGIFFASGTYTICHWLRIIATRQKARFVQFNRLTIDEYVSISYILPYLTQSATYIWNLSTGKRFWRDRSEGSLIFQMCLVYLFYLIIICKFHGLTLLPSFSDWLPSPLVMSFCSGAWPHAAYHRCYEPKSAEDEANIRPLRLT